MRPARALALGVVALSIVGCTSPEATRARGGGPGADPGNRRAVIEMHEGARIYWRTPQVAQGAGPAPGPSRPTARADR